MTQQDLPVPQAHKDKLRREWGTDNIVGMEVNSLNRNPSLLAQNNQNVKRLQAVRSKIATFCRTAIYPQQLSIPRQYATTQEGCFIYKVLEGREVDNVAGGGTRVVVQENMQQARFIMSPLCESRYEAIQWAITHTGATVPEGLL